MSPVWQPVNNQGDVGFSQPPPAIPPNEAYPEAYLQTRDGRRYWAPQVGYDGESRVGWSRKVVDRITLESAIARTQEQVINKPDRVLREVQVQVQHHLEHHKNKDDIGWLQVVATALGSAELFIDAKCNLMYHLGQVDFTLTS
jgi:hypothetical protein